MAKGGPRRCATYLAGAARSGTGTRRGRVVERPTSAPEPLPAGRERPCGGAWGSSEASLLSQPRHPTESRFMSTEMPLLSSQRR